MRVFVPVLIVLILVVGALLFARGMRKSSESERIIDRTKRRLIAYETATGDLRREIGVQTTAGVTELGPIDDIIRTLDNELRAIENERGRP